MVFSRQKVTVDMNDLPASWDGWGNLQERPDLAEEKARLVVEGVVSQRFQAVGIDVAGFKIREKQQGDDFV